MSRRGRQYLDPRTATEGCACPGGMGSEARSQVEVHTRKGGSTVPLWRAASSKVRLLQRVALFEGLSPRHLGQIARLADEVEVAARKRLAAAGETGRELFVIVEGNAVVRTPRGRTVKLGPGQFFGEMSLIDGGPRSATVEASTPMHLLVISQREFWELLAEAPAIARHIMRALSQRLREADAAFSACS